MPVNKILCLICSIAFVLLSASDGHAQDDISKHTACHICGMDRQAHDYSRMLLEFDDKTSAGTCSIHCTAVEMAAHREKTIIRMLGGDYATKELVDAQKAHWVIGGRQTGVMTRQAKWAFAEKAAAA